MPNPPLLDLFRSHGHDLKREGKSYKTRCPFHDDGTPSLSIDPQKGLWHCFGCNEGGDGITFLEKAGGLSFGQAADRWRSCGGLVKGRRSQSTHSRKEDTKMNKQAGDIPHEPPAGQPSPNGRLSRQLTSEDLTFFKRLQDLYAQELATNEEARAYLKSRGLTDGETIRAFGLGYVSGKSLPQLAPAQRARLEDIGILNDKGNETLYGCLVCPLYDTEGNVVSFWGRRITECENPHRQLGSKIETTSFGVVNYQAFRGSETVVLVEGFLDAVACYQGGIRNAVPVGGVCGSPDFVRLLHQEGVQEVLLAFDADEAGDKGAGRLGSLLERRGIGSVRVRLDYDPLEFFARGGTAQVFRDTASRGEVLERGSDEGEVLLNSSGLLYRARLAGPPKDGKLKAQIVVIVADAPLNSSSQRLKFCDVLNLYVHKTRKAFANACAQQLSGSECLLASRDIESDLQKLTEILEQRERSKAEARTQKFEDIIMNPDEKAEAEKYLSEPNLVSRLQDDMSALGYVGEEEAKLLVYLIGTSRKLPKPLSGIISSGSGAGKSFLAELLEQLMPPEDVIMLSRLSPQALFYMPCDFAVRKILMLEERAGGEAADYAIRSLQSKDELTQLITMKDPATGQMSTQMFKVEGPIAYLETTTESYLNPENTSRCFEIPLDESPEQTKRIHEHQRRSRALDGLKANVSKTAVCKTHHQVQRLLRPVHVVIPYAEAIEFPARYLRTRRDHERFLSLIEASAFLHQFQRVVRTASVEGRQVEYIEATVDDYALAYRLAVKVLWVSLDELSRWGRELLEFCRRQVQEVVATSSDAKATDVTWTRRQLRESLGWMDKRMRGCVDELSELEYFRVLSGGKGKTFVYGLNTDFSHTPKVLGLLSPQQLREKLRT